MSSGIDHEQLIEDSCPRNRGKPIIEPLTEAPIDGDTRAFKDILAVHREVVQKESFYERARLSRRTVYRILAPVGNPTLENIARLVKAIARSAA